MALGKPVEYKHNNDSLAFVDANFVRGGARTVSDLTALYALASQPDQLKVNVTRVYVQADGYSYMLIDLSNAGNSNGWKQIVQTTQSNLDAKLNVGANTSLSGTGARIMQAIDNGTPQALYIPRNGFVTDSDVISAITSANYSSQNAQYIAPASNKIFQAGQQYWENGYLYLAWKDNFSIKVTVDISTLTAYKAVATYALMVADTTPSRMTYYKVATDENKGQTNTLYQWWPDGKRMWIAATNDN